MKIRTKLSFFATFLVVTVVLTVSIFIFIAEKQLLIDEIKESQMKIIRSLTQVSKESLIIGDPLIIINYLNFVKRTNPMILYGYVTDDTGKIIAHTDPKFIGNIDARMGFEERDSQGINEQTFTTSAEIVSRQPFLGEQELGIDIYEISLAEWRKGERVVTARIGFLQDVVDMSISKTIDLTRRRIILVSIITLIIGVIIALLIAVTISKPIKILAQGTRLIGEGKLNTEIDIQTKDELGWLAREFNKMALKLKELDEMKEEFVSNVTHELRSPLGAIESYVNLMLEEDVNSVFTPENNADNSQDNSKIILKERHEHLVRIKKNTERLGRFINDLLDISKIEAGRLKLNKENALIANFVDDIVSLFRVQAENKNISISTHLDNTITSLYLDEDKIKQVLTNLLNNAIKFTDEGGTIEITTKPLYLNDSLEVNAVHALQFAVTDTGVGIAQEYVSRVFDKFEQVTGISKKIKVKGTGLGLAIAKGIVEAHGGKIWVESTVGQGSSFYFTIPVVII
ncbi:MAG: HAMP domain-containing sensor histidine kinase [Elusimicrobiota bacterium]